MTRSRCGSLLPHRTALSSATSCQLPMLSRVSGLPDLKSRVVQARCLRHRLLTLGTPPLPGCCAVTLRLPDVNLLQRWRDKQRLCGFERVSPFTDVNVLKTRERVLVAVQQPSVGGVSHYTRCASTERKPTPGNGPWGTPIWCKQSRGRDHRAIRNGARVRAWSRPVKPRSAKNAERLTAPLSLRGVDRPRRRP